MSHLVRQELSLWDLDVLQLAGQVEGKQANSDHVVALVYHHSLLLGNQVLVKDRHHKKVCPWSALEARRDLDHPVKHVCPLLFLYVVPLQRVLAQVVSRDLSKVGVVTPGALLELLQLHV